jgi:hypothetical protein
MSKLMEKSFNFPEHALAAFVQYSQLDFGSSQQRLSAEPAPDHDLNQACWISAKATETNATRDRQTNTPLFLGTVYAWICASPTCRY